LSAADTDGSGKAAKKMLNDGQIIIRPATLSDIGQIYPLERSCSRNPWSRDSLVNELSNPGSISLVMQLPDGQIAGFVCSSLVLDELQILETAVRPDYRNRGLGSLLINSLLSQATEKNAVRASLEVRPSNHPAIKLYEKTGFKNDGARKGYYQDGEDAVLMSKEIFPSGNIRAR
jgi:ribosomal-protein-alanine N-acetyltransferase